MMEVSERQIEHQAEMGRLAIMADFDVFLAEVNVALKKTFDDERAGRCRSDKADDDRNRIRMIAREMQQAVTAEIHAVAWSIHTGIPLVQMPPEPLPDMPSFHDPLFAFWLHARIVNCTPIRKKQ